MALKEYEVSIAVIGVAHVTVMAESEADAIAEAEMSAGPDDVNEWQTYPKVVEGNIYYGPINRARIDNVYDPNEDDCDQ